MDFKGFSWDPKTFPASAPSHGISLSPDGTTLYVLDAPGDVIRSATRRVAKHLPALANTRKYIEVDFDGSGRVVWAATSRSSIGYRTPLGR